MTGRVERSLHKTGWNYVEEAKFIVTVKGGQPKPDIYEWTLPYGQKLTPGQRSGNYYAKPPTVSIPQITFVAVILLILLCQWSTFLACTQPYKLTSPQSHQITHTVIIQPLQKPHTTTFAWYIFIK